MKTRLLSAILTAAILLTMLSCHKPEINPGKTDTAAVTERLTDTENTRRPFRMVNAVGEVLCFQAERTAKTVILISFAFSIP